MGIPPLNARVGKVAISNQYLAIARKRLKIDGYYAAMRLTSIESSYIHVTFTAIVPGAFPGEPKCAKMANF